MARSKKPSEARVRTKAGTGSTTAASQIAENSVIRQGATQYSDQPGTQQRFASSWADTLHQRIVTQLPGISGFGMKGTGLIAVVVVGVVVLAGLALKYLH